MFLRIVLKEILFMVVLSNLSSKLVCANGIIAELSDDYFSAALVDYAHSMVFFHSPKCSYCQDYMPEFEAASDELIRNEPPVHAAKVDCLGSGKTVCKDEQISNLPTIKIYKRGEVTDEYDGPRTAENLVTYLKNLVGITSIELNSKLNFEADQKDITVIAFLKKSGNLRESYFNLPPHLSKDIKFGHYTIEPDDKPMVKLIRPEYMWNKFEPSEYYYINDDGRDLLDFIVKHRHGIVGLRTLRNFDDFVPPLVIVYYDIDLVLRAKMFAYWRNRVLQVAKNYSHVLNFAVSPIDEFKIEFNKFGIDLSQRKDNIDKEQPIVFAIFEDKTKYLMEEEFSVENLRLFVEGLVNNKLEPHLRSQPIPKKEEYNDFNIQPVVAKNFKEIILKNDKDIILEFYAPWCNVCKEIENVLEEIKYKVVGDEILIYKIDGTANEVPKEFSAANYPTIYWIPKETKVPVMYKGGRTIQDMLLFISEQFSGDLYLYDNYGGVSREEL